MPSPVQALEAPGWADAGQDVAFDAANRLVSSPCGIRNRSVGWVLSAVNAAHTLFRANFFFINRAEVCYFPVGLLPNGLPLAVLLWAGRLVPAHPKVFSALITSYF